jgi:hypothetical protein
VKNAIYATSLLLAFLVVLGHDLIPHQHDLLEYGLKSHSIELQTDSHHSHDGHHDHDSDHPTEREKHRSENNRKSSFPYHNHFYSDTDFDYTRLSINNYVSVKESSKSLAFHASLNNDFTQYPGYTICYYRTKPLLIRSLYQPAANPLRGPPAIA